MSPPRLRLAAGLALSVATACGESPLPAGATSAAPTSGDCQGAAPPLIAAPVPGSAAASATGTRTLGAVAPSPAEDLCRDLVDAKGATARETDVAKRAPGRGPRPGQLRGVDASTPAPWKALRDQGFAFAFAQAGFGVTPNPSFSANWAGMKACGFPRGAYHFVNADRSGEAQAAVFLATRGTDRGEIPSAIDLEKPPRCADDCCGKTCSEWQDVVRGWVDTVQRADGRPPMIYAVEPFWNQCLCGTKAFSAHPLWHPAWPKFDFPDPVRFGGWSRWDFYQYDGNVKVGDGVIDMNLFRGDRAELDAFLQAAAVSAPVATP